MSTFSPILKKFKTKSNYTFISPSERINGGTVNKAFRNRIRVQITQEMLDEIFGKKEVTVNAFVAEFNCELSRRLSAKSNPDEIKVVSDLIEDVLDWDFDDIKSTAIDVAVNKHKPSEYDLNLYGWTVSSKQANLDLNFKLNK